MEFENLIKLIQTVSDSKLTGFQYEENGTKIKLHKEKVQVQTAGAQFSAPVTEFVAPETFAEAKAGQTEETGDTEAKPGKLIKSPLVGTFYAAPAEDADPFVTEGAAVKSGQIIAIVEAMKLMNDIESEFDGTVAEVLVANGEAVEYGQPLFRIV